MAALWIEINGKRHKVELTAAAPLVDDIPISVDLQELEPGILSLLWTSPDGRTRSFRCIAEDESVLINGERIPYTVFDPRSLRSTSPAASASGPRPLKAPMPGRIVRVLVAPGETVAAGQGCVVIEAMKMQNELKAPKAGVIAKLAAIEGETVTAGAILLLVE